LMTRVKKHSWNNVEQKSPAFWAFCCTHHLHETSSNKISQMFDVVQNASTRWYFRKILFGVVRKCFTLITNVSRCITNVWCCISKISWPKSYENLIVCDGPLHPLTWADVAPSTPLVRSLTEWRNPGRPAWKRMSYETGSTPDLHRRWSWAQLFKRNLDAKIDLTPNSANAVLNSPARDLWMDLWL
jgi:hypothetical protein